MIDTINTAIAALYLLINCTEYEDERETLSEAIHILYLMKGEAEL